MADQKHPATKTAANNTENFLTRVMPWPTANEPGYVTLHWHLPGQPFHGRSCVKLDGFMAQVAQLKPLKQNLYFGLSRQQLNRGTRSSKQALALKAIWLDLDVKPTGYPTIMAAIDGLFDFIARFDLPPPTAIVVSGNGLHVYWISDRVLPVDEWRRYANGLKAAALAFGLKCDAGLIANAAQVLRIPGTRNYKTDPPKPVLLYHLQDQDIEFAADLKVLLGGAGAAQSRDGQFGAFPDSPPRDESGSGHGFRFMQDCHDKGMSYEQACDAIRADKGPAGEWANRVDQRQLRRAYDNSKPSKPSQPEAPHGALFQSSAEFVAGFVPPDYLIDGLMQRRYVYSFTAKTGDGKTAIILLLAAYVARGTTLTNCAVEKGRVLFFVGENPDDVRTRWVMLCEVLGEDPDQLDVVFMPFTLDLSAEAIRAQIDAEAAKAGPFALLIVDTSASYYSGDDENDNVALGKHARMLRSFVNLPGGPTILVTCHPAKNPDMTNLLPRGGGAFLAEVDGNLVAIKDANTMLVEVTTHGKFRGPDFAPLTFKLVPAQSRKLVDSRGRLIWSIYAEAVSNTDQETLKGIGYMEQDEVLRAMLEHPDYSLTEIARHLGWKSTGKGEPNRQKVQRLMVKLQKNKLVKQRHDERYILTKNGESTAKETPIYRKN